MTVFMQLLLQVTALHILATRVLRGGEAVGEQAEGGQGLIRTRSKNAHFVSEEIENIILPPGATTEPREGLILEGTRQLARRSWKGWYTLHPSVPPLHLPQDRATRVKSGGGGAGWLSRTRLPFQHMVEKGSRGCPPHTTHIRSFFASVPAPPAMPVLGNGTSTGATEHFCPRSTILLQGGNQRGREPSPSEVGPNYAACALLGSGIYSSWRRKSFAGT